MLRFCENEFGYSFDSIEAIQDDEEDEYGGVWLVA